MIIILLKTFGLVCLGFVIGVIDSVVGGGNLFTLSVFTLLGLPPLKSIATMQLTALVQNLAAAISYIKKGLVNWKLSALWGIISIVGSYLGSSWAIKIDPHLLQYLIATFMVVIFLFVVLKLENIFDTTKFIKKPEKRIKLPIPKPLKLILLSFIALILGIYGGFYGAARGLILLVIFFMITKKDLLSVAANTKMIDLFLSVMSSYVFISKGTNLVDWELMIPISLGGILGGYLGVDFAQKLGVKYLKYLIYIVTLSATIKIIFFNGVL